MTYDFVPESDSHNGLDYSLIEARAGRGLLIELVDENDLILATTTSDENGNYRFTVARDAVVKVRVKAQLLHSETPSWDFKVTDNTNDNALYSMEGGLIAASDATAVRNLHAASGWTGGGYTEPRVAAPFAILDSTWTGIQKLIEAGNQLDFPALEFRWSVNNKAADGDQTLGEIGTSYFDGDAIYVLGDQNSDTDEYDRHVILHEWGHYFESAFSRSDSIGGSHGSDQKLDMRVALSEGFANALSAIWLDDPIYGDSSGMQQLDGFSFDVSNKDNSVSGWYSESSINSVLYNFYVSNNEARTENFADIFNVLSSASYTTNTALLSIYVFADELRKLLPEKATIFDDLLVGQDIAIANAFGEGETNSGGYAANLPIYEVLPTDGSSISACSSNQFGAYNGLGAARFMRLEIASSGTYEINVEEIAEDTGDSDPDIYLYDRGELIALAEGILIDEESLSVELPAGTYVVELVDSRVLDTELIDPLTACFNVRTERLNLN